MSPGRIEIEWIALSESILRNAGPNQLREMRRAFYAGALALRKIMEQGLSNDLTEEEEYAEVENIMLEVDEELARFAREIIRGVS